MKSKINIPALFCAIFAAICLVAVICGAKHQFIWFLTFGGLAYALFTEDPETERRK